MTDTIAYTTLETLRAAAKPIAGRPDDYDDLIEDIGERPIVLIGEASHGTHEFYRERAKITERLIEEKGFIAVAVEADWPDAGTVNRFVRGLSPQENAIEALRGFRSFPAWMWRNTVVLNFIGWLHQFNMRKRMYTERVGFYGLDLYSLYASVELVLAYLDKTDPEAANRARFRYSCLGHFGEDPEQYGYSAAFDLSRSCEEEVVLQLREMQRRAAPHAGTSGAADEDDRFFAEQNARLIKNAEAYYRGMFHGETATWNLRDRHMFETLQALAAHLHHRNGVQPRIVVWAHNSHLGDARATEMRERGELNLGQLISETYGSDAYKIGFSTYTGTVTAASDWGENPERKFVRPSLPGSVESLLHAVGVEDFYLAYADESELRNELDVPRLERAIGVVYRPETERLSHYLTANLANQFDTIIHIDESRAVEPIDHTAVWERGELPETYPSGI